MNIGRIVLGGLLAGLIVNVSEFVLNGYVVAADLEAALKARNIPPIDMSALVWFVVAGFAGGIVNVWLYAAIRPRFGPGVKTAVWAGVFVWLSTYALPNAGLIAIN